MLARRTGPRVAVTLGRGGEQAERAAAFRYRVLVGALGQTRPEADHAARRLPWLPRPGALDLLVECDGRAVASLATVAGPRHALPAEAAAALDLKRFAEIDDTSINCSSELVLDPEWQGKVVLPLLLGAAFKLGRRAGARLDLCRVPTGLVAAYEQLGYRRYGAAAPDASSGLSVPMLLILGDTAHLRACRSPLLKLTSRLADDLDLALWFARAFPEHANAVNPRLMSEDDFWDYLTKRLRQSPVRGIPLFDGLAPSEARRLLADSTVLRCQAGETIVRAGERGREMYVLLEGAVRVVASRDGREQRLARFERGQLFGEMALVQSVPRSADVVAESEVELLLMSEDFLRHLTENQPTIAAKVLLNLSLVLCRRLSQSNSTMLDLGRDGPVPPQAPTRGAVANGQP